MFYNYWNYWKYLGTFLIKLLKGNKQGHKLFIGKNKYGNVDIYSESEGYNRLVRTKLFLLDDTSYFQEDVEYEVDKKVYYRIWWNDGSKSPWKRYGEDKDSEKLLGKTHLGEISIYYYGE